MVLGLFKIMKYFVSLKEYVYSKVRNHLQWVCIIIIHDFLNILSVGCLHYILMYFVIVQMVVRTQIVVMTFAHKFSKDGGIVIISWPF